MEKTTPLYATHQAHGGKIVPFAGYLLPVQYQTGVIAEHMAVREACLKASRQPGIWIEV
mgnify:FL=1